MASNITFHVGDYAVPFEALRQNKNEINFDIGWALDQGRAAAIDGIKNQWLQPTESFNPERFWKNSKESMGGFERRIECLSQLLDDLEEQKTHPIRQKCFALLKAAITIALLSGAIFGACLATPHIFLTFAALNAVWNVALYVREFIRILAVSDSLQNKLLSTLSQFTGFVSFFLLFRYYDAKILEQSVEQQKRMIQELLESASEFAHLTHHKPSPDSNNTHLNLRGNHLFKSSQKDVLKFLNRYKIETEQVS